MSQELSTVESVFQTNVRQSLLPPCNVDLVVLVRILELINTSAQEAAQDEISKLQAEAFAKDQFESLKRTIRDCYRANIEIVGANGEYFSSTSPAQLTENALPATVNRITFDTSFLYRTTFNRDPQNSIKLVFDFTKPPLLDFISNPSRPTSNESGVQIVGQSQSWAIGVYQSLLECLKPRKTNRAWLHRASMYDLLLWIVVMPLSFWNLNKLTVGFPQVFTSVPGVLAVFASIYFFILVLFLFRAIFNYARWLFPFVELDTSVKSVSRKQRIFFFGLLIAIVYGLVRDITLSAVKSLW
jgi:hypothetical protein